MCIRDSANGFAILHHPECPHPNVCRRFVKRRRHTHYGFSDQLQKEVDRGLLLSPQVWVSEGVEVEVVIEVDPPIIQLHLRLTDPPTP